MTENEFNFKNEIRKIPINSREEQIIKLVEDNFDEAVRRLNKGCGKKTYWEYPLIEKEKGTCGHFICGKKYDCDEGVCLCLECLKKLTDKINKISGEEE